MYKNKTNHCTAIGHLFIIFYIREVFPFLNIGLLGFM